MVDINAFLDLEPGKYRLLPGTKDRCVFRKKPREGHQDDSPGPDDFIITTCARAHSFVLLMQRNQQISELAKAQDTGQPRTAVSNPSSEINMASNFDPLAELIREFGPSAHLGEELPSGAPEYDSTYPDSMDRGPFGLSTAAYGARRSLPVNRRNPVEMNPTPAQLAAQEKQRAVAVAAKRLMEEAALRGEKMSYQQASAEARRQLASGSSSSRMPVDDDTTSSTTSAPPPSSSASSTSTSSRPRMTQAEHRKLFGTIAKHLESIQAERQDVTGRPCTLKEAWAILKGRQNATTNPRAKQPDKAVITGSPKQIAARTQFRTIAKLAQKFQVERGCSPKEAWALARDRYLKNELKPNPSPWNVEFGRLVKAAIEYQKTVKGTDGRPCTMMEAWAAVYPVSDRHGGYTRSAWTEKFKELVSKVHAYQRSRNCSLAEAWAKVYPRDVAAKPNPAEDFDQNPEWAPGGSYVDYVEQDMYDYEPPASPPNEPWQWDSQYEYRVGAYGPAAQFPPTNRRNPARMNPDGDYTKWSKQDLVELSNRGDEDASMELARREEKREAKNNPRIRRNG